MRDNEKARSVCEVHLQFEHTHWIAGAAATPVDVAAEGARSGRSAKLGAARAKITCLLIIKAKR